MRLGTAQLGSADDVAADREEPFFLCPQRTNVVFHTFPTAIPPLLYSP
jgi:hypothetical protein